MFSTLAVPDLELLAWSSADLQVAAGGYALRPGAEEPALFAALAGNLEVFTAVDGIGRRPGGFRRTSHAMHAATSWPVTTW